MDQPHEYEEEEEADDVHICGLCRAQFSDMHEFINHKKLLCPVRLARKHKQQQQSYRTCEGSTNPDLTASGLLQPQGASDDFSRVDMIGKPENSLSIQLNQDGETIGYLQFSSDQRPDLTQASLPQAMDAYGQDLYGQGDPNTTSHEYVLLPNSTTDDAYTKQNDLVYYQTQLHTQIQPSYSHNIQQTGQNPVYAQSFDGNVMNHHAMQQSNDGLELSDSLHSSLQNMPLTEDEKLVYNKEPLHMHGNQTGDPYNKPVLGLMRHLLTRDPKDHQGPASGFGQEMQQQPMLDDVGDNVEVEQRSADPRAAKLPSAESKYSKKAKQKSNAQKTLKEKKFLCEISGCSYKTAFLKDLERHMRVHTGERPYKCDRCEKMFTRSDKLQLHLRYHLNDRSYKCSLCPYTAVEKGTLNKHMLVHKDEKPFSCQLCTYKCRTCTQLSIHLRIHTGDHPYNCKFCEAVFKVSSDLTRHNRIHTGEKPYYCKYDNCGYQCAIKSNLRSHYRIHHKNEQLACKSCSFTTSSKKALKEHCKEHTINEDLVCKECNYQCANKTSLRNHQKLHTEDAFQCTMCSYTSKQKGNLVTHMKRKHAAKVMVNKSSKLTGQSKLLKELKVKPIYSHESEEGSGPRKGNIKSKCVKSFQCSHCKASFVREDALKCHMKQHKETSLSTAYAVLKLQQPVINDSATQSSKAVSSVATDGVNVKSGQLSNRERINLANNQNVEPLTFSTSKALVQSSSYEALGMSSPEKPLHENLGDLGVTVRSTNPMLTSPSALTYSIHGNVSHSQASLGINDILIAAGMSGVHSNSNSPTAGMNENMKDIQLGSVVQSISGTPDGSPGGKNFLLAQSPQDVPSVQVLQNISLPYIKLPNGQVLILTGQTNLTVNTSNMQFDNSSSMNDIQSQGFVQQPVYNTEQIIQCAADSTTPTLLSPSNQTLVDNPENLSSQQQGAIPIQIILPNDSQQTLPIVSQLLSSVMNRNVSDDGNQLQVLQATSQGSGSQSMQSFVIQIPAQTGSMKDVAGNSVPESQSFVLQIPASKYNQ